jgi:HEAT repeat protein
LVQLLQDPDLRVRKSAAASLGHIGVPEREVIAALVNSLSDERTDEFDRRYQFQYGEVLSYYDRKINWGFVADDAERTLERVSHDPAVEVSLLLPILNSQTIGNVTCRALRRLAKLGRQANGAAPAVLPLLNNPDPRVRQAAADAVRAIGFKGVTD